MRTMRYKDYKNLRKNIIEREASHLVAMGVYDDIDEAMSEAEAISSEKDSFCELDDIEIIFD